VEKRFTTPFGIALLRVTKNLPRPRAATLRPWFLVINFTHKTSIELPENANGVQLPIQVVTRERVPPGE
jgi:hypothetical protein